MDKLGNKQNQEFEFKIKVYVGDEIKMHTDPLHKQLEEYSKMHTDTLHKQFGRVWQNAY